MDSNPIEVPSDPHSVPHVMHSSTEKTSKEMRFVTDDARFFAELIGREWSLGIDERPNIAYVPESYILDARVGAIYVYLISRTIDNIASVDYRTLKRTVRVGFRISTRFRDRSFWWSEEVIRILMKWRRAGQAKLNGWSFLEISGDNQAQNQSGWYTATIEVKGTKYNQGILSAGFGDASDLLTTEPTTPMLVEQTTEYQNEMAKYEASTPTDTTTQP